MQILLRIYGMLIPLSALNLTGFGVQTTFLEVEYASQNVDQIKKAEGIFQKPFHRCSKDVQCEFVVKNVQTNDHQVYSREVQIPSYKGNLRIWKKHKFFATATQDMDPCSSNPCQNGGTCIMGATHGNQYSCKCAPDFIGADCKETWEDNCYYSNCIGLGKTKDSNACLRACWPHQKSRKSAIFQKTDLLCRCCGNEKIRKIGWKCILLQ